MLPPLKPSQKGTSVQHQEASPSKKGFARLFSIPRRRSSSDTAKSFEKSAEKSTEEKVERQVASLTLAASNSSEICVSRPNRAAKELRRRSLNLSCRLIHIQHFAKEHTLNDLYQLPLDTPIEVVSLIIAFGQGTLIRHLEKETDLGLKESGGMESLLSQRYDLTKDSEGIFNSENEKKGRSTLPQSTHALALYRATLAGLQFFVEPLQFFQLLSQAVDSPLLPMRNKRSLIRVALEWALLPGQEGLAEGSDLFLCLSKIAEKGMLEKCEPESSSLYQALLQRAASDSKRKKSLQFEESPLLTEGPILEKMEKGGDEQPRILAQKLRGTMAHFLALIPPSELWQKEGGFYLTQAAEYFNALTLYFVYQILASQNEIEACSTIYFIRSVQEQLLQLGDFNTLLAIECAFSKGYVSSLTKCHRFLKKDGLYFERMEKFQNLLSPFSNFGALRQQMGQILPTPVIPSLVLYTKDITGAKEIVHLDDKGFNKVKMRTIGMSLLQFQTLQSLLEPDFDSALWQAVDQFNVRKNPHILLVIEAFFRIFTAVP